MPFPHQLVVFDLDGTLVDSAPGIAEAVNRTLVDWQLARVAEDTIRSWIGEGARALVDTAFGHAGSDADIDALMPRFMDHYGACLPLQARLYPGVRDALEGLRARGARIALCTNKPQRFIAPLLERLDIDGFFDAVVGGDTLPEKKPDARPLLHIARELGHAVDACLMVGDSATDLHAAQAAGMDVALVGYGYARGFDLHAAGVPVLDDLRDLLDIERDTQHL